MGVVLVLLLLACGLVCALKGKWLFFALGWFTGVFWIVGACRLAKPQSRWARMRYGERQLTEARQRFGSG